MEEPLAQFFIWWDGPDGKDQAVREQESTYRIAQRAFAAGYRTRYEAPIEPSRDALTAPRPDSGQFRVRDVLQMPQQATHVSTATIPDARTYNPGELAVEQPDPFANVRFTGPQQAAMDNLYPLKATATVWDGEMHAPPTMPMRVVPAELPVRGPVEDIHGRH